MTETTTAQSVLKKEEGRTQQVTIVHDKTNSWPVGNDEWIPVANMTNEHLAAAKKFAQGKEEYFFHKSSEFGEKVDMLDKEAERRGVTLPDRRSKFTKNTSRRTKGFKTL